MGSDTERMHELIGIQDIQNYDEEEQAFTLNALKISDHLIYNNKFKLIKLIKLQNHGGPYNMFHTFSLFGVGFD